MSSNEGSGVSRRALLRKSSMFGSGLLVMLNLPRPLALAAMQDSTPAVFTREQWQTVEAITGRIIPTDHQPGAIEANCVNFIDKALANEDAKSRPDFVAGLTCVQILCSKRWDRTFAELDPAQQDALLGELAADTATPWPETGPASSIFFDLARVLTIMGFMADPKYGGNADMSGWRVARYPGPRHHHGGYTAAQMVGEEQIVTLWGEKM